MRYTFQRLSLAMLLILCASAILLISDVMRHRPRTDGIPRVAVLQFASTTVMEEGIKGLKASLKENGFVQGRNIDIKYFNAEGDIATANAIAHEMTNAPYEMLVTFSTPCLQAVYTANRARKVRHIYGLVADPAQSGIGVNPNNPAEHPPYMVGLGTLLPIEECFYAMREMLPALQRVGVAWNAGEMNSEIYVKRARIVAKELGIDLIESNVENSAQVSEAIRSLIGRGVQMIWVGGDSTISANVASVIDLAKRAQIPVISVTPAKPERGTLMDYGISFYEAGAATGDLVSRILKGADPAQIPVEDVKVYASRVILLNRKALVGLKEGWRIPESLWKRATIRIDATGIHRTKTQRKRGKTT